MVPTRRIVHEMSRAGEHGTTWCHWASERIGLPLHDWRIIGASPVGMALTVKPFSATELVARVRAALRRSVSQDENLGTFELDDLFIDYAGRQVSVDERSLELMQYIRSQPSPTDVTAARIPVLAQFVGLFVDIYVEGFISPFTGETVAEAKARIESVPTDDRYAAAMVESYRLASDPFLLDIIHILLAQHYVGYFTTGNLAGANEFLGISEIQSLAGGFDAGDYAISAPSTTPPPATDTGSPETDRAALVALYNETDGANWRDSTNWLSDMLVGEWHGVTADADGRVTALGLFGNQLRGAIPSELGNLASLQELNLDYNELSGEIPVELGNLASLKRLVLNTNQLTGPIPSELGALASLQYLYLSYNELSGEIPSELGDLSSLEILTLDGNQLSGSIPSELGNLSNLRELWLRSNQLSGCIPDALENVPDNDLGGLDLPFCSSDS